MTATAPRPRISVFPKCYFDALCAGEMDYAAWIRSAPALGGEGLEHYDGFFPSFDAADVDPALAAMAETGQVSSMLCFSPDFTHADAPRAPRSICFGACPARLHGRLRHRYWRAATSRQTAD